MYICRKAMLKVVFCIAFFFASGCVSLLRHRLLEGRVIL
jgi:hypothetical protein